MGPSPPRDLPRQRAAATASVITSQRQHQLQHQLTITSPAHNDVEDPLALQRDQVSIGSCQWVSAYRRAGHKRLPRQLREFGWRLLHAGVKVGARRMLAAQHAHAGEFVCLAGPCLQQQQQPLETLSHLFVECPVAVALWQWFAGIWQQVQPGAAVPIGSTQPLLLDDSSVWAPANNKAQLWTYMRLLLLESIWAVRCSSSSRVGGGQPSGSNGAGRESLDSSQDSSAVSSTTGSSSSIGSRAGITAKAVACRFKAELQRQMLRDWQRAGEDVREGSGIPLSWLKGAKPTITVLAFWTKWSSLFALAADGTPCVAISTAGL